ncbi:TetR family transcriptional regulator [Streptomyces cinnamoneus]|uniref:TetR family transcriptional regulator n=1 Tax=Streptomyces cinnamoneus TaxID=53446 RepID=A0A2G1XCI5_STRCJ|nr:TetR/AcrR family transcriptional regulator [Streptomyces cinnamoneus]PHQ48946.1 TetR family transcriptional regulator [Streptomyces cinnamoneus]PPT14597.1 TetR family transcriptional regulator [Streptomyces cinnamoneus]
MGNREDLLAGAKHCLRERGYARTTVRDIASAAGIGMAAIGYHFGSREALLNAALLQALDDWSEEIGRAVAAAADAEATAGERYEAVWSEVVRTFSTHRPLWLASVEAFVQAEHAPELRRQIAAGHTEGRRVLAAQLLGTPQEDVPDGTAHTLGTVLLALLQGVMMQSLADPGRAPSATDVAEGLRALTAVLDPAGSEG